ncbi:exodeoxyribonuclease V subunit alpha [Vibrio hannami]|uniref:exodeoxyribonuclease V subunit alpha n=1 Tax=Vibrio hannami TaxID=2717094 RepID=UPI0024105C11|nr:exodeoxyribonuclease V subunit alpha [Vibrio hannami]MDG3087356.1 exodeoxyribonuclease V subunit alpha [Vibrio hannami]
MLKSLEELSRKGAIRQLDYQFAKFVYSLESASEESQSAEQLAFIAGVVSAELAKGHICIRLNEFDFSRELGVFGQQQATLIEMLDGVDWKSLFSASASVGLPGDTKPLIFDGERLYLQRYWFYEETLANKLKAISQPIDMSSDEISALKTTLDQLFAREYGFLFTALQESDGNILNRQQLVCDHLDIVDTESLNWPAIEKVLSNADKAEQLSELDKLVPLSHCINWQKVAAAVSLTRRFSVISGGPGTGKTTTVAKLLAALAEQSYRAGQTLNIKLVAPTGKAAARLTESLGKAIGGLPVSKEIKALIPEEGSTVHRLLGAIPGRAEFRHNASNPLHLDLLIVDEASMVDLPMMYKLIDALPSHARLILLGDKDQLASVEAGAVLGDICSFTEQGYSRNQGLLLSQLTGHQNFKISEQGTSTLSDSLCMLRKSYRFDARSGIGQLARVTNEGVVSELAGVLTRFDDIALYPLDDAYYQHMIDSVAGRYSGYLNLISEAETSTGDKQIVLIKDSLKCFSQTRLLCAVRDGEYGISGLNSKIEKTLAKKGSISPGDDLWYSGRPVMVTKNDYSQGLYNGDIGICCINNELKLKVYFELPDGTIKSILPSRVPEHETAFAMTIHKSQGSEFSAPVMVLPPQFSPVLTKELIYTGITRAKESLSIYAAQEVLAKGIRTKTERNSGLKHKLA